MRRLIKRAAVVVGGIAGVLVLAAAGLYYFVASTLCGNTIKSSLSSPDGARKAVIFERSCGATTGFSTQISVVDADDTPTGAGNVLIADGAYQDGVVRLHWRDARNLVVMHGGGFLVHKTYQEVGRVSVTYGPMP